MRSGTDRRAWTRSIALAVLLLAMLAGVWVWRRREGDVEPAQSEPALAASVPEAPPSLAVPPRPASPLPTQPAAPEEPKPAAGTTPRVIELRVRDVADGQPVAGLTLTARWAYFEPSSDGNRPRYVIEDRTASSASNADGIARLDAPPLRTSGPTSVEVGPDWHVLRFGFEERVPEPPLPLHATQPTLLVEVRRAFRLSGRVVDAAGLPIPGVTASFTVPQKQDTGAMLGAARAQSDANGRFDIGPFAVEPADGFEAAARKTIEEMGYVTFTLEGYAPTILDPRSVSRERRDSVVVTLTRGATLAGRLVDARGRPISDGVVAVEYGTHHALRRGTRTDGEGRWRLDRLSAGPAKLRARAFAQDAKVSRDIRIERDELDMSLEVEEIRLSRPPNLVRVLGLQLCDVDAEIRAAYEVPEWVRVLIFDPGPDPQRLRIGHLERGDGLYYVGEEHPASVREAVEMLLKEPTTLNDGQPGRKRVVYTFWNERMSGTNTQYVNISDEDRKHLRDTLDQLSR